MNQGWLSKYINYLKDVSFGDICVIWAFFMNRVNCYLKLMLNDLGSSCVNNNNNKNYSSIATYLESLTHRVEVYVVFIKYFMYKYRLHTKQCTHYKSHTVYCCLL